MIDLMQNGMFYDSKHNCVVIASAAAIRNVLQTWENTASRLHSGQKYQMHQNDRNSNKNFKILTIFDRKSTTEIKVPAYH